jgi:hypothetical protein
MKQNATFCKIISIMVIINLIGCTSLQTIEAPPDKLHEQIRHENLVNVGDKVRIITEDEKEHQFVVTAINESEIRGKDVTVPIDSIVSVQKREFSSNKTTFTVIGTLMVIVAAVPVIAVMALAL